MFLMHLHMNSKVSLIFQCYRSEFDKFLILSLKFVHVFTSLFEYLKDFVIFLFFIYLLFFVFFFVFLWFFFVFLCFFPPSHKSEFKIYNSKIIIWILLVCYMYCFWYSDATWQWIKISTVSILCFENLQLEHLLFPITWKLNASYNWDAGFCINTDILMLNKLNY